MAKKLTGNMVAMGNLKYRKKHYIGLIAGILLAMIFICIVENVREIES